MPSIALAATVTIDATASIDANRYFFGGSQTVFTTDLVGYKFYVDSTGECVYSKTTNGGAGWGTAVVIDGQTDCTSISVWYDQWTPNDYGNSIHIVTMETASAVDHLFYNRLDTSTNDSRLLGTSPVTISASSSQVGTFTGGINSVTMTKGTDDTLYAAISDGSDSFVVRCSSLCATGAAWTEAGSSFMDLDNDWNLLLPLAGGSILLINRDISADDMRSRTWNGSAWSVNWNVFDANAIESATYDVSMAAVVDYTSGDILLAYGTDHDTYTVLDHDIRTAKFSSGTWTATSDVFTNRASRGLHQVAMAQDINTGVVYVAYTLRTTPLTATTANVYFATSSAAMSTWGAEQGPLNAVAGNLRGLDINTASDERVYVSWYDPLPDDVFGNTAADLLPITKLTASGTATTSITASTSNVYTGGQFVLQETLASRNVTDISITETGTVAANTAIANIRLRYDLDTSAPYNCTSESYTGSEPQFGATDTNGFSAANGTSTFSDLVNVTPIQALCLYVVLDVLDSANDNDTIAVAVQDPNTGVLVTGGVLVTPRAPVRFATSTLIRNDTLTQTHFHWRNDDGNETGATSATAGVEDSSLTAIQPGIAKRLRFGISNEGSIASNPTSFRLEYAASPGVCTAATSWVDVGAVNDAWNMSDSGFITDASNTTNITVGSGGVTDENSSFLVANGGVRDTSSQTAAVTVTNTNHLDLEFSVVASSSAQEGTTYCFRLTDAGNPLPVYQRYPEATITADFSVSATGTQVSSMLIPNTTQYVGAQFILRENFSSRIVTDITVTETGSVNASSGLANIKLQYDLDTTVPYNCASEAYSGSETQFGAIDTNGFSGANGSSTFSGSLSVSTTSTMCVYVVLDVTASANNGETLKVQISSPANDVVVNVGSVSPSTVTTLNGTTTLQGAVITQGNFHWRNDNGPEATSTSATLGVQNARLTDHSVSTPIRLRLGLSNEGTATSAASTYRLEYGTRVTTCSAVGIWIPVDTADDEWNIFNSTFLQNGSSTTNIAIGLGGITDENPAFLVNNNGIRDTTATTSSITLSTTQFTEFEFSLTSTPTTLANTAYCFRLTAAGVTLPAYSNYPEILTAPDRDFKTQRGVTVMTTATSTLVAGVDYVAPSSNTSAFVRITDSNMTGSGRTTAGGGAQNADDITVFLASSSNLMQGFTLNRPPTFGGNTRVTWEIVEFIGASGTDNEMIVRGLGTTTLVSASTTATSTAFGSVVEDSDVVVFITGIENRDLARNLYYAGQVTAEWSSTTNRVVLRRGAGGAIINVSYAVVEFTGQNWRIQRSEHTYSSTTITETETINPVNSLARTFIHTQKRMTAQGNVNNFGHEVWLSSIGAVSFRLEPLATVPAGHTSVAWIIENQQTSAGAMKVQRYNGTTDAGTEPVTIPISLFSPIDSMFNASIMLNNRVLGVNTNFPLAMMGARITSTSTFEFWRSEASGLVTYRTEIVEWPINGLAVRQNYYAFYVDNNALTPSDLWPPGVLNLGENTPITAADEPLGEAERVRLRMSLRVGNATLPAGLYDFKLQYGLRSTPSCTAIAVWTDVGAAGSGELWRGFAATGTTNGANLGGDPPSGGELLLSVADVAGSLIEENISPPNPFLVAAGDDVEYDWLLEHNSAVPRSFYCFRMVRSDGTTIDGYFNYPQLRTAGYSPITKNWRWYNDENNETPTAPLANEVSAPIEVINQDTAVLRVTVGQRKNVLGQNVKFKLQFDDNPSFTNPRDVAASSTCTATSTWCYALGAGANNATITTKVLTDSNSCSFSSGSGCGTHNSDGFYVPGLTHPVGSNREYSFYLKPAGPRVGAVYYFRLFEVLNDVEVPLNVGSTYPSAVAQTATLTMIISGLPSGTTTAGVVLTATSTPATIAFGALPVGQDEYAAHRIAVTTNATEGYRVLMFARQMLLNSYGTSILPITGTNATPSAWAVGCATLADGCVGYHTTDATLSAPAPTRFSALDSYAGLSTATAEIMYSPIPAADIHDILYRVLIKPKQPAGDYQTEMVYIAIPTY